MTVNFLNGDKWVWNYPAPVVVVNPHGNSGIIISFPIKESDGKKYKRIYFKCSQGGKEGFI